MSKKKVLDTIPRLKKKRGIVSNTLFFFFFFKFMWDSFPYFMGGVIVFFQREWEVFFFKFFLPMLTI